MITLDSHISFTDNDIIKWNNNINTSINIQPQYNNGNYVDILIYNRVSFGSPMVLGDIDRIEEPIIEHKVDFSVPSEYIDIFNKIIDSTCNSQMMSRVSINSMKYDITKPKVILKMVEHSFNKSEYVRFEYVLNGKLSSVMMYDKFISTANDIFNMMIDMNFKVGEIVSNKLDKGKNYIVKNYRYISTELRYVLIEILENNSLIIKYGDEVEFRKDDVCNSRDNRIEQILSKNENT